MVEELYGFTYAPKSPAIGSFFFPPDSVVSMFANLLHRPVAPDRAEINGWVNSGLDIYTIESAIAGNSEFVALASTGILV